MAKAATAAARDQGEPLVTDGEQDTPLRRFSRELAERFPNRMIRRYHMPVSVRECREVFLVEMTSREEIEAAIMADATMSIAEKRSVKLSQDAERRESIRLTIVGLGKLEDKNNPASKIVYTHTNTEGVPFGEITDWTSKAWGPLHVYFSTLNGVPTEEIDEGLKGAQTVGAFALPTSAIRASASSGK